MHVTMHHHRKTDLGQFLITLLLGLPALFAFVAAVGLAYGSPYSASGLWFFLPGVAQSGIRRNRGGSEPHQSCDLAADRFRTYCGSDGADDCHRDCVAMVRSLYSPVESVVEASTCTLLFR
jgi:hypothetical protein